MLGRLCNNLVGSFRQICYNIIVNKKEVLVMKLREIFECKYSGAKIQSVLLEKYSY